MLTVLSILAVLAVLFVAAAVATREGPILVDAPVDMADVELPAGPLQPEDLRAVRFALAVRGYRMDEVDRVIERAAAELAQRDQRILELESQTAGMASVAAPAAAVVLAEPPPVAEDVAEDVAEADPVDEPIAPAEPPGPIVPTEPPLDAPPPPPDEPPTPDVPPPPDVPDLPEEAEREPVASLLPDDAADAPDDAAETAVPAQLGEPEQAAETTDVDASEPPLPPPVEVAVVPTEVAPLPEGAASGSETSVPEREAPAWTQRADGGSSPGDPKQSS